MDDTRFPNEGRLADQRDGRSARKGSIALSPLGEEQRHLDPLEHRRVAWRRRLVGIAYREEEEAGGVSVWSRGSGFGSGFDIELPVSVIHEGLGPDVGKGSVRGPRGGGPGEWEGGDRRREVGEGKSKMGEVRGIER